MSLQPVNGHEILVELAAAELIPVYRIIKFNASDKTKANLAGAGDNPLAVAIPYNDEFMPDGAGGLVKRTGYQIGERITAYDSGTVYVELGANVTAGQKCVPMAGGKGAALADDTYDTTSLATLKTSIQAAFAARLTVLGEYQKSGSTGDIVPVKIEK